MVEGGNFKCGLHNFETESKAEFDQHCKEEQHVLVHSFAQCIFCHKPNVPADGLPHNAAGEIVGAVCDDCFETQVVQSQKKRVAQQKK
jgi:DNA-binding transcriptional regulator PaaX